jgi:hypothetical protein
MSTCKYCGKDAGWLRSSHKECQQKHDKGAVEIVDILASTLKSSGELESAKRQVSEIASEAYIDHEALQQLEISALERAINQSLSDDFLSREEEDQLGKFVNFFGISNDVLSENATYIRAAQAAILREIMEGDVPDRMKVSGNLPFNFQKSEQLVWLFQHVEYLQPRTRTTYQGASHGVSVRVAKGLYFRTGQFSGNPIVNTQITSIDVGVLAATTKHIYFAGNVKSLRIKYDKIISFAPYSDGISIQRDSVTKPDIFKTGDGWFIYNLVMNLAQFEPA